MPNQIALGDLWQAGSLPATMRLGDLGPLDVQVGEAPGHPPGPG
jgi:hypothetical protein